MAEFLDDVYAPGGQRQLDSKLKTIVAALRRWSFDPWPPTAAKIHALGATLKSGGYLAAPNYLYSYKVVAERLGYSFDPPLQRALKDSVRSCERGVGGARQALPLDMDRLHLLPGDRTPWSPGGAALPQELPCGGDMVPLPRGGIGRHKEVFGGVRRVAEGQQLPRHLASPIFED